MLSDRIKNLENTHPMRILGSLDRNIQALMARGCKGVGELLTCMLEDYTVYDPIRFPDGSKNELLFYSILDNKLVLDAVAALMARAEHGIPMNTLKLSKLEDFIQGEYKTTWDADTKDALMLTIDKQGKSFPLKMEFRIKKSPSDFNTSHPVYQICLTHNLQPEGYVLKEGYDYSYEFDGYGIPFFAKIARSDKDLASIDRAYAFRRFSTVCQRLYLQMQLSFEGSDNWNNTREITLDDSVRYGDLIAINTFPYSNAFLTKAIFFKTGSNQRAGFDVRVDYVAEGKALPMIISLGRGDYELREYPLEKSYSEGEFEFFGKGDRFEELLLMQLTETLMLHRRGDSYFIPTFPGDKYTFDDHGNFIDNDDNGMSLLDVGKPLDLQAFMDEKGMRRLFGDLRFDEYKSSGFGSWLSGLISEITKSPIYVLSHRDYNSENTNALGFVYDQEVKGLADILFDFCYFMNDYFAHKASYEKANGPVDKGYQISRNDEVVRIRGKSFDAFDIALSRFDGIVTSQLDRRLLSSDQETHVLEMLGEVQRSAEGLYLDPAISHGRLPEYLDRNTGKRERFTDILSQYADAKMGKMLLYMNIMKIGRITNQILRGKNDMFWYDALEYNMDSALDLMGTYAPAMIPSFLEIMSHAGEGLEQKASLNPNPYYLIREHAYSLKEKGYSLSQQ